MEPQCPEYLKQDFSNISHYAGFCKPVTYIASYSTILYTAATNLIKPDVHLVSYNHFHSAKVCVYACVCVCTPPRP